MTRLHPCKWLLGCRDVLPAEKNRDRESCRDVLPDCRETETESCRDVALQDESNSGMKLTKEFVNVTVEKGETHVTYSKTL